MLERPRALAWCSALPLPPPNALLWAPEFAEGADRVAVCAAGGAEEYPRSPPRFMFGAAEFRATVLLFAAPARFVAPSVPAVLGRSTFLLLARVTALEF